MIEALRLEKTSIGFLLSHVIPGLALSFTIFMIYDILEHFMRVISANIALATVFVAFLLLSSLPIGAIIDTARHWFVDEKIYARKKYFKCLVEFFRNYNFEELMNPEIDSKLNPYLIKHPRKIWDLYEMGGYLQEFFANTSIVLIPFAIVGVFWLRNYSLMPSFMAIVAVFMSFIISAALFWAGGIVYYESRLRKKMLFEALKDKI